MIGISVNPYLYCISLRSESFRVWWAILEKWILCIDTLLQFAGICASLIIVPAINLVMDFYVWLVNMAAAAFLWTHCWILVRQADLQEVGSVKAIIKNSHSIYNCDVWISKTRKEKSFSSFFLFHLGAIEKSMICFHLSFLMQ